MRDIKNKLNNHGLQQSVCMLGFLSDNEAYRVLKSSKVFVFPSYEEGWGIAICEAMALGLPVVAYDLPAYEVFRDAITRISVGDIRAFSEAVLKLLSHESSRIKLAKKATEVASRFEWDKITEENWSALLTSLADLTVEV